MGFMIFFDFSRSEIMSATSLISTVNSTSISYRKLEARESNHKNGKSWILDAVQESPEVEVSNHLRTRATWWHPIGRIQIIPNPMNFSNTQPMVLRVADICFFISVVFNCFGNIFLQNRNTLDFTMLFERSLDNLNTKVTIICHITTRQSFSKILLIHLRSRFGSSASSSQEFLFFFVKRKSDLRHLELIKQWSLHQSIESVYSTHHISSLFFKVDVFCFFHF